MESDFIWRYAPRAAREGRVALMGIINATPDSFSDGGLYHTPESALHHASQLLSDGADILDVGAESTRRGFAPVSACEQISRLIPIIRAIRGAHPQAVISVDTRSAEVAAAALENGAIIVNDVSAAEDPDMLPLVKDAGCGIVLMNGWRAHIGAEPRSARPGRLVQWVRDELVKPLNRVIGVGIDGSQICLDPGFGYGLKNEENFEVLEGLSEIVGAFAPIPILVGPSRKHFLAAHYPQAVGDLDAATHLFCAEAVQHGAKILRIHSVVSASNRLNLCGK